MYRFIQNIGDFFTPGYYTEDFASKVIQLSGYDNEAIKEFNSRFVAVVNKIIMTGFLVFCNGFYAFLLHFSASFRLYFAAFALHKASAFNSAVKGNFVRIFKVTAHGNSVSKAGNLNAHRLYQP